MKVDESQRLYSSLSFSAMLGSENNFHKFCVSSSVGCKAELDMMSAVEMCGRVVHL